MSCGIYKIENNINHMIYIGQSIDIENRFIQHKNNKNNYDIHVALREYGIENFSFDIIELCSKKELNEREIYWISYYNCQKPNGYNCTPGGTGWNPAVEASKIRVAQYDLNGNFIKEFESISDAERQTLAGHISDVLDKENKIIGCIEIQGSQHYDDKNGWYNSNTIKHDRMKKEYCYERNIPLLILDYSKGQNKTDFQLWDKELKKFLEETLNEL